MRFPIAILATTALLALGAGNLASASLYGCDSTNPTFNYNYCQSTYAGSTLVGHYALGDLNTYEPDSPDCATATSPRDVNNPVDVTLGLPPSVTVNYGTNGFSYACMGVNSVDLPTNPYTGYYENVSFNRFTDMIYSGNQDCNGTAPGPAFGHNFQCSYNTNKDNGQYHVDFNCLGGCEWISDFAVCFYDATGAKIGCDDNGVDAKTSNDWQGYPTRTCSDDTDGVVIEGYMPAGTANVVFTSDATVKTTAIFYGQDIYATCMYFPK